MSNLSLRARASWIDVLLGRASLVGARAGDGTPGLISPVEARLALGIAYEELAALEQRYLATRTFTRDLGVVVRTLVAHVLASGGGAPVARPYIVSASVDNLRIADALDVVFTPAPADRARVIHFAHAHALTLARNDARLRGAFAAADAVLPDGIGIRIAAAILGVKMLDNVNGTDLLPLVCERARAEGIPLVLVGGAPGVAEACAANLRGAHPGLAIPIASDGFLDANATGALVRRIGDLGRCIVLVGMGSPLQERWAREHLGGLGDVTALTVGGLFDFYSGRIRRAPAALREVGLEWAYRLVQEPTRLARRYLLGNPRFLALAVLDRLLGARRAPELPPAAVEERAESQPVSGIVRVASRRSRRAA